MISLQLQLHLLVHFPKCRVLGRGLGNDIVNILHETSPRISHKTHFTVTYTDRFVANA